MNWKVRSIIGAVGFVFSIAQADIFDFDSLPNGASTNSASVLGSDWEYKIGNGATAVIAVSNGAVVIPGGAGINTGVNMRVYNTTMQTLNDAGNSFHISCDVQSAIAFANSLWYGIAFNIQDDGSCYMLRMCTSNDSNTITANYISPTGAVSAGTPGGGNVVSGAGMLAISSVYHFEVWSDTPGVINYIVTGENLGAGDNKVEGTIIYNAGSTLTNGYAGFYINAGNSNVKFDNLMTVPEPVTIGLMGIATAVLFIARRKIKR